MRIWLLLLVVLGGCSPRWQTCTLAAYSPIFVVEVQHEGSWDPGTWTFHSVGEGEGAGQVDVAMDLPFDGADGPAPWTSSGDTSGVRVVLSEANDAVEQVQMMDFTPDVLTVAVSLDDVLVGTGTFTPEYDITEPNGDGCGELRSGGTALMAF